MGFFDHIAIPLTFTPVNTKIALCLFFTTLYMVLLFCLQAQPRGFAILNSMKNPPEINETMKEEARQKPGGYIYCIDPRYAEDGVNGAIPPQGIIGAYPVDTNGDIIPEFTPNPNYIELND